jgi:DNA polymerase-3 subunit beta
MGDAELTSRLIDGTFPNYTQVIPKDSSIIATMDTETLSKAVRTASIFARDSANIIHWKLYQGRLTISANAPSLGESESVVDIEMRGEGGEIAFNSRYIIDYLTVTKEKQVVFKMNGSLDPGVFLLPGKKNDEFLHLIMPVRVQK